MNAGTIAALLGFLALAGGQLATLLTLITRMDRQRKEIDQRFDKAADEVNKRFDEVDKRFDEVDKRFDETSREIAELRERMARLECSLDGFLAGRRDRDAA